MALAGITLGALAPVTVQAAHTGVTFEKDGSAIPSEAGNNKVDLSKGASAYATDAQKADAESEASVQVVSGFLSLDAVPDFSFGRAVAGKTANLLNGQSVIDNDGNQEGLLQITESRNASGTATPPAGINNGFNLSAQLGSFSRTDGSTNDKFKLNLTSQPLRSVNDGSLVASLKSDAATLTSNGKSANILSATKEDNLMGSYKVLFNTNDSASLFVPEDAKTENAVSHWKGVITWTLSTGAAQTPQPEPAQPGQGS